MGKLHRPNINLYQQYFRHPQVQSWHESVTFRTRLIPLSLSQLELVYFLLGLGWTDFISDLVGTEECDDKNTRNGDDEYTCGKVMSNIIPKSSTRSTYWFDFNIYYLVDYKCFLNFKSIWVSSFYFSFSTLNKLLSYYVLHV